jgi:DNA-directed RNA polymerase subunit L|tara:strand:+ start:893 stop:1165 length:273 start_codon:yes stop_codon:yes gene_type:complete
MEVKILEEEKGFIKIEIIGEDHTLANALRKELWNDSHVKVAGYNIDHPLVGNPVLIVETDGKEDPKKALNSAVDRLKKKNSELLLKFSEI